MRNCMKLIRLEDGFEGTIEEIAERLNSSHETIARKVRNGEDSLYGTKYEFLGFFQKVDLYKVIKDGETVFNGSRAEIRNKFNCGESSMDKALKGQPLKREYFLRRSGSKYVKIEN